MTSIKLMLNKDRVPKSGLYPLVAQVIHNRRKKLIYLDIKLFESEFNSDKEKVRYKKGKHLTIRMVANYNHCLVDIKSQIEKVVKVLEDENPRYSVDDIVARYKNRAQIQDLMFYMKEQVQKKKEERKAGIAEAYHSTMRSVQSFIGEKVVWFIDIDFQFLEGYVHYLYAKGDANNTVAFYWRNFRAMYNRAKSAGARVVPVSPFTEIKIQMDKTVKRALSKDEIRKIANFELLAYPKRELARDMFIFSYYTRGMPFVDVVNLKSENIIDDVIYYRRSKTNQPLQVSLTNACRALIAKYKNNGPYIFPVLDVSKSIDLYKQYRYALADTNRELKIIAKEVGIHINLTTYVARHTWATVAKETGAPISQISDSLGHTSEATTLIYLKDLDESTLHKLNEEVAQL